MLFAEIQDAPQRNTSIMPIFVGLFLFCVGHLHVPGAVPSASTLKTVALGRSVTVQAEEPLAPERRDELRRMRRRSERWRLQCTSRLRRVWLPQLRLLPGAKVTLKSDQSGTSTDLDLQVQWQGGVRSIHIFWDPDECDAGAPNSGWRPDGFDWRAPSDPLEKLLAAAGNDCLAQMPH